MHDFYYYLAITGTGEPNSPGSCAGLIYPGALAGWGPSWNAHGVYLTQNSLFPNVSLPRGLGSAFVQTDALCGESGGRGIDGVVKALSRGGCTKRSFRVIIRRMGVFHAFGPVGRRLLLTVHFQGCGEPQSCDLGRILDGPISLGSRLEVF